MSGTFSILIADDNDDDVTFLLRGFTDIHVNVTTTRAWDGESCLELLGDQSRFRLAVIDLHLPKRTGAQVIEMMQARGQSVALIVILTSHISEEHRRGLQVAGVRAVLEKPIDLAGFAQLATRLVALMAY